MEPFVYSSAVLAIVKLYYLLHNTRLGVFNKALDWTQVNAHTGVCLPYLGKDCIMTDVADINQTAYIQFQQQFYLVQIESHMLSHKADIIHYCLLGLLVLTDFFYLIHKARENCAKNF